MTKKTDTSSDLSPEDRYRAFGKFDETSYASDRENFPEYFDKNGWPLFGEYDPYALNHPITGDPWFTAARVPTRDETNPDYNFWFKISEHFNKIIAAIPGAAIQVTPSKEVKIVHISKLDRGLEGELSKRYWENLDQDYTASVISWDNTKKEATRGTISYLRLHVFPGILKLMYAREASAEFASLLTDLARCMGTLVQRGAFDRSEKKGKDKGKELSLDPQVKWCLHFRRHHQEDLGMTATATNRKFLKLVRDIIGGNILPPDPFDKEWFEKTLTPKKEEKKRRRLANRLRRANKHPRKDELLDSKPDEDPKIPPPDASKFLPAKK